MAELVYRTREQFFAGSRFAQDQDGNIALGYSVAGADLFPSVAYTSRSAGDALGTMEGGEVVCHEGTGAQVGSSNRWGDYSSMSVDPSDDCTFWYTQEYYATTGSFDFNTRICSFRFPDCGEPCVPTEDPEVSCDDFVDNDCDGDFDCADSDCASDPACICIPEPEICDNGIDDDCDGELDEGTTTVGMRIQVDHLQPTPVGAEVVAEAIVDKVIEANPGQVAEYQSGKDKLIGYFVGQVMKETGGKANPGQVNQILKQKLG